MLGTRHHVLSFGSTYALVAPMLSASCSRLYISCAASPPDGLSAPLHAHACPAPTSDICLATSRLLSAHAMRIVGARPANIYVNIVARVRSRISRVPHPHARVWLALVLPLARAHLTYSVCASPVHRLCSCHTCIARSPLSRTVVSLAPCPPHVSILPMSAARCTSLVYDS